MLKVEFVCTKLGKSFLYGPGSRLEANYRFMPLAIDLSHLVFLFETVSLRCLHLVDVLQEVGDPHGGVELTRVIRRALPPTVTVRRASQ